jgi:hypothetical protein
VQLWLVEEDPATGPTFATIEGTPELDAATTLSALPMSQGRYARVRRDVGVGRGNGSTFSLLTEYGSRAARRSAQDGNRLTNKLEFVRSSSCATLRHQSE